MWCQVSSPDTEMFLNDDWFQTRMSDTTVEKPLLPGAIPDEAHSLTLCCNTSGAAFMKTKSKPSLGAPKLMESTP